MTDKTTRLEGDETDAAAAAAADAQTNDQAQADEEAFAAGFAAAFGDEPARDEGKDDGEGQPDDPPASGESARDDNFRATDEQGDGDKPPQYLTRDEVDRLFEERMQAEINRRLAEHDAVLQQEIRKVHGNYGALKGRLDEVAKPRQLSLNRVREEFPELASLLDEDLREAGGLGAGGIDREAIEALVKEREEAMQQELQKHTDALNEKFLNFTAPGWEEKVTSSEFAEWLKSVPPEEAKQIEESNDPFYLAATFRRFDDWAGKQKEATREAADKAKRLGAAEPASSSRGAPPPSRTTNDEAAFEAGFHEVRGVARR